MNHPESALVEGKPVNPQVPENVKDLDGNSLNALARMGHWMLNMLKALWGATFGRLFSNRVTGAALAPRAPASESAPPPSREEPEIEQDNAPAAKEVEEAPPSPAPSHLLSEPRLPRVAPGMVCLEDAQYGVTKLESGTVAVVNVEDGSLMRESSVLMLEDSAPPQCLPRDRVAPKLNFPDQIAPIVDNPVGNFPYPTLMQMTNMVEPRKILEGFRIDPDEDGSFRVGENRLRIQKTENAEHVITEIGSGRALTAGNVSLVQMCRAEAGMEVLEQSKVAGLLYDRFVAGNSIGPDGIKELEALPSPSDPETSALRYVAQSVGAPELLAQVEVYPNHGLMHHLPDDSPIIALYDNIRDEAQPMAVVYGVRDSKNDPTEGLLVGEELKAVGALDVATSVMQNRMEELTVQEAHQIIRKRMGTMEPAPKAQGVGSVDIDD